MNNKSQNELVEKLWINNKRKENHMKGQRLFLSLLHYNKIKMSITKISRQLRMIQQMLIKRHSLFI